MLVVREPWISYFPSILYFECCHSSGGGFLLLFFHNFVSGVCLSTYYTCIMLCLFLVCWVRENFSGGQGHIFSVWLYFVTFRGRIYKLLILS